MKFATKFMSYFLPHIKGITSLPCKIQKTKIGEILLHVTQQVLFNGQKSNKYDKQNNMCIIVS